MGRFREFLKRVPLARRAVRWARGQAAAPSAPAGVYLGDNTVLAVVQGLKMYLDTRDTSLTPHLLLDGSWEPAITKAFLEGIREGMTVVDVGANVGYYTLLGARAVGEGGKVFAFEPEPRNFELMRRSVDANGLRSRVALSSRAVSDRKGSVELYVFGEAFGGSHSLYGAVSPEVRGHVTVETISLDEALGPDAKVDVMKVDVEGAEPLVFRGMKRILERSPNLTLIMEFAAPMISGAGADAPEAFLSAIREAGFALRRFTAAGTIEPVDAEALLKSPLEVLFLKRRA